MSITTTQPGDSQPAVPSSSDAARAETSLTIRQPLVWLGVILLIGLGTRWWSISGPLQQDEYGSLYAVAEREGLPPGTMPTEEYPLKPVKSWQEVSERSVLPYGIVNPLPLYHWLLYAVAQVCPITELYLRLPSLLAGLGCIAGVYFLCRKLLGAEVALVAALLAAVDPMQIETSVIARPYAISNLACVLSFWAVMGIFHGSSSVRRGLAAVGYGVSLALIGYMNPILLLVMTAHVGMVLYWWLGRPREEAALASTPPDLMPPLNDDEWAFDKAPKRLSGMLLFWLGGCALAVALLAPELGYFQEVWQFTRVHHDYLFEMNPPSLLHSISHVSTFVIGLLAVMLATVAMKQLSGGPGEAGQEGTEAVATTGTTSAASTTAVQTAAPPSSVVTTGEGKKPEPEPVELPPRPENPDLLWLGRCWFFLPFLAFMVFGFLMPVNSSRYFTYVSLGGAVLLAYLATRERLRDVRLGVVCMVALAVYLWGFVSLSEGTGLFTSQEGRYGIALLNKVESWQPGDVVLYRSGFLEGDFLPDGVPQANLAHVEGALASPITTLYTSKVPRPYILLSRSQRRNDNDRTLPGLNYDPSKFYTDELARTIAGHSRYWLCTEGFGRRGFFASVIPWLANTQQHDMTVARRVGQGTSRKDTERYFLVPSGTRPEEYVAGLSDAQVPDFTWAVLIKRATPSGAFSLGAIGAAMTPNSHITVPTWLVTQSPTPRLTKRQAQSESATLGEGK